MGVVALDFVYPLEEFRRTTAVILRTFAIITAVSLAIALLLTVIRVRQFSHPIRRLAQAANRIAAGERSTRVAIASRDEIGQLGTAFNAMAASLEADEIAIRRKIAETTTLYEVAQEITAQVDLEPTLKLIVDRARGSSGRRGRLAGVTRRETDTFTIQAFTGRVPEAMTTVEFKAGEGMIGLVAPIGPADHREGLQRRIFPTARSGRSSRRPGCARRSLYRSGRGT